MISNNKENPKVFRDFLLKEDINTEFVGKQIYCYNVTDSTNNEAKKHSDLPEGTVFLAKKQTAGRGRKGREWKSDHTGLWFSVLLKPDIAPETVFQITLIIGIAVSRVISGSKIKWPNDIVLGNKKVCGILTEMSTSGNKVNYVIAGVGINVNTEVFPDDIITIATSLYVETGKKHSNEKLLSRLCEEIEFIYKKFLKSGFSALRDEYMNNCITLNREVVIHTATDSYTGTATDIDENGELIVKTKSGELNVLSGEVSVRGIFGYI